MPYRAILFDVGGPLDLEFAWEIAVDSAIAAACSLEGIRLDQPAIEAASERAVEAFASAAIESRGPARRPSSPTPSSPTSANSRRRLRRWWSATERSSV